MKGWPNGGPLFGHSPPFDQTWPKEGPPFGQTWPNEGPPFSQIGPNRGFSFDPVWSNDAKREGSAGAEEGLCRKAGEGRRERAGAGNEGRIMGKGKEMEGRRTVLERENEAVPKKRQRGDGRVAGRGGDGGGAGRVWRRRERGCGEKREAASRIRGHSTRSCLRGRFGHGATSPRTPFLSPSSSLFFIPKSFSKPYILPFSVPKIFSTRSGTRGILLFGAHCLPSPH